MHFLPVQIQNHTTLEESLQSHVIGEWLQGCNAYSCNKCDAKVPALKRSCFSTLPRTLMIQLKRFEFDLEILARVKVNRKLEFPMKLQMTKYCKEYLDAIEKPDKDNASVSISPQEYELVGVLVHSGTADTGHYYSLSFHFCLFFEIVYIIYIQFVVSWFDQLGRWLEFNDESVSYFDESQIPEKCYGGTQCIVIKDKNDQCVTKHVEKTYSAYLLVYQRREPVNAYFELNSDLFHRKIDVKKWEEHRQIHRTCVPQPLSPSVKTSHDLPDMICNSDEKGNEEDMAMKSINAACKAKSTEETKAKDKIENSPTERNPARNKRPLSELNKDELHASDYQDYQEQLPPKKRNKTVDQSQYVNGSTGHYSEHLLNCHTTNGEDEIAKCTSLPPYIEDTDANGELEIPNADDKHHLEEISRRLWLENVEFIRICQWLDDDLLTFVNNFLDLHKQLIYTIAQRSADIFEPLEISNKRTKFLLSFLFDTVCRYHQAVIRPKSFSIDDIGQSQSSTLDIWSQRTQTLFREDLQSAYQFLILLSDSKVLRSVISCHYCVHITPSLSH
ncbi:ubiquitin hydrolase [Reticulomyxa filosa]|uniref:Ubiquitin hydrolase n=1 Tax=Reticulomyxa filosa TaxID=46433 RepID=X6MEF4_RETFI|nr:ubiquitin hydrolase [Reticulomyxa filosa]|eukprot:ETO12294.1 ubiquitin hydrolase [Reticulomyxa filosa]